MTEAEPQAGDLHEYGRSLGVDLVRSPDLLYIVQQAFDAPLPGSWSEHMDEEGRVYFFQEASSQSTWEHPTDAVYRELIGLVLRVRQDPPADPATVVHDHLFQVHQRALAGLEGWSGPYTSDQGEFYYNESLKVSSWENPVMEKEQELALRHSVLCRCLMPDYTGVGLYDGVGESSPAGVGSDLLEALRLPLGLVKRDSEDAPHTPSTTRSFHTCRSTRSGRSDNSGRTGAQKAAQKSGGPQPPVEPRSSVADEGGEFTFASMEPAAFQAHLRQQAPSGA